MKITIPDPLSSEERALAAMLARVAPHGVPSPEIDASILSASHDAVAGTAARSRRPRWPVAMGVAASMVLAVGVAWQLRPTPPETAGLDVAAVAAPASVDAPAAAAPAQEAVPAGPAEDAVADSTAAPPHKSLAPPQPRSPVMATQKAAPAAALPAPVRAPPAPPAPPAPVYAPSSPAPSAAAERNSTASAGLQPLESARQADSLATASEVERAVETTTAAPRRGLRVAPSSERVQDNAPPPANGAARARRTDLQVPVAADARLQPGDWLERVRTRYGLGDEDAARRSLLLFVQDHPTEAVPDDLEPLLDE